MINNPVLRKELLLRFRIRQPTPARIGLGILITLLVVWIYWTGLTWLLGDNSPSTGQAAWSASIGLQFVIICLIGPSLTANAIAQEKEQQTWEMLIFTCLRPAEIILGKLIGRLSSVAIICGIFLPFTVISWLRTLSGGIGSSSYISPGQFCMTYLVVLDTAVFFATIGLFLSWLLRRTLYAILVAYSIVIGGLCIGTFIMSQILSTMLGDNSFFEYSPLMWLNPPRVLYAAMAPNERGNVPALVFGLSLYTLLTGAMLWYMIARFRRFAQE